MTSRYWLSSTSVCWIFLSTPFDMGGGSRFVGGCGYFLGRVKVFRWTLVVFDERPPCFLKQVCCNNACCTLIFHSSIAVFTVLCSVTVLCSDWLVSSCQHLRLSEPENTVVGQRCLLIHVIHHTHRAVFVP